MDEIELNSTPQPPRHPRPWLGAWYVHNTSSTQYAQPALQVIAVSSTMVVLRTCCTEFAITLARFGTHYTFVAHGVLTCPT